MERKSGSQSHVRHRDDLSPTAIARKEVEEVQDLS
jgi:hypothetical protein